MHTASVAYPRPRVRTRVDHACLTLLRSVMADGWGPEKAARDLLVSVQGDHRLLRLLKARISSRMLDRPTRFMERATLTLDHALAKPVETGARGPIVPRQGGAHV